MLAACASRTFDHPLDPNNTLGRLRLVDTFDPPNPSPAGMDFSRERLWVVDALEGNLYRMLASNGHLEFQVSPRIGNLLGVADDGTFVWLTQPGLGRVIRLNPASGEIQAELRTPDPDPHGIDYQDGLLWIVEPTQRKLLRIDPTGIEKYPDIELSSLTQPEAVTFRGEELWLLDSGSGRLVHISTAGAELDSIDLPIDGVGLACDGDQFYVSERSGRIYVFELLDET